MSHFDESIAALTERLREQEARVAELKKAINAICLADERPPLYQDVEVAEHRGLESVRPDEFYGQALNGSAKRVLDMRNAAGLGAATVREIYDVLLEGGYDFQTRNAKNAMDGLRISLSKSSHTFHKLPNGRYGLNDWYPNAKTGAKRKRKGVDSESKPAEAGSDESDGST